MKKILNYIINYRHTHHQIGGIEGKQWILDFLNGAISMRLERYNRIISQ